MTRIISNKKVMWDLRLILLLVFSFSCGIIGKAEVKSPPPKKPAVVVCRFPAGAIIKSLTGLEEHNKSSVIYECNLSKQGIEELPDLSDYKILHLDLSHNNMKGAFHVSRLPQTLVTLNITYNEFDGELIIPADSFPNLREIKCYDNKFIIIDLPTTCDSIWASSNRLGEVRLNSPASGEFRVSYMNLSHNWDINNKVCFDPKRIKHIVMFENGTSELVKDEGTDCP